MPLVVFDSSAVIALLKREPGAETAERHSDQAAISAVNLQEVAKKLHQAGMAPPEVRETLDALKLDVRPHGIEDAYLAASLVDATKRFGRGLGDRSCMALAVRLGVPALTTDRAWSQIEIPGLEVQLIR